ncbi:MAG: hypothetical protein K2X03_23710 [Bryobacteraceae bacterium]|nr:hypothetical protein [Bryobacteraceae bacterium]
MTRRETLALVLPAMRLMAQDEAPARSDEVRLLCFAPSPYTKRMDALRAGYGLTLLVRGHLRKLGLSTTVTLYDGAKRLTPAAAKTLLTPLPKVLLVGSSTWSQGSNRFVREFFEVAGDASLLGVKASTWGTSGGAHTGGEMVAMDTQRSLQGLGASVFTLGQKQMVLTTDEFEDRKAGEFSLLDVWFLDQFARMVTLQTLEPAAIPKAAAALDFNIRYYAGFPKKSGFESEEIQRMQKMLATLVTRGSATREEFLKEVR